MNWWEKSSEVVFQRYGKIFSEKLFAFMKLGDYFEIDPSEICDLPDSVLKRVEKENRKIITSQLKELEPSGLTADDLIYDEYKNNFEKIRTNIVYTIGCFLFLLDQIKLIDEEGEKEPLSLYVFYTSSIKSLGDCVGLMEELTRIIIDSRRFSTHIRINKNRKDKFYSELSQIHENSTKYSKEFRNYLTHRGYLIFYSDGTVPVYGKKDFQYMPEVFIIETIRSKQKTSVYLNSLFNEVVRGIENTSDYLIAKVLKCPNWRKSSS